MREHHMRWAVIAATTIALTACAATSSNTPSSPAAAHFPVTITEASGPAVTITQPRHLIVPLSPTPTQRLFAIAAGSQAHRVAVQRDYPPCAPLAELSRFPP